MYSVSLARFEGPLDLLLHLIEKAEVDIKDIFISEITSQYLEYMAGLDELEADAASEFASVAATLLLIKSRSLLPKPAPVEEEDEEDPETVLLRQLQEYKLFKEAGKRLNELKEAADHVYAKLPEEFPLPPKAIELDGATLDQLYDAFVSIMFKVQKQQGSEPEKQISRDEYNISERITFLSERLKRKKRFSFSELFIGAATRQQVIVTFMAMLELLSSGVLSVEQDAAFGEITICRREEQNEP